MAPPRSPDDVESSLLRAADWMAEEDGGCAKERVADGIFKQAKGQNSECSKTIEGNKNDLEITHVDRYRIDARIGSGAMGMVYRAYDPQLDRPIAIKLLHADQSRTETAFGRMMREARSLARLSHPNVIHVYDVGMMEEQMYIAMELIEGQSLRSWLHQSSRTRASILETMLAAGRGLVHAHRSGLVHRDFKPDNIIVGKQGRVCVVDFGLARPASEAMDLLEDPLEAKGSHASNPPANLRLTHTGMLMGTPRYLAPEVFKGNSADALSDQYSFCVTLFEALYARVPFSGKSVSQYAVNVLRGELVSVRLEDASAKRIHEVICRGMQLEPGDRFSSLEELLGALEKASEGLLPAKSSPAVPNSDPNLEANLLDRVEGHHENHLEQLQHSITESAEDASLGFLLRSIWDKQSRPKSWRILSVVGLVVLGGLVLTSWILTQSEANSDGRLAGIESKRPSDRMERRSEEALPSSMVLSTSQERDGAGPRSGQGDSVKPDALDSLFTGGAAPDTITTNTGVHERSSQFGMPNNEEAGASERAEQSQPSESSEWPELSKPSKPSGRRKEEDDRSDHPPGLQVRPPQENKERRQPKASKHRFADRRRVDRNASSKHSPSTKDWCSLREDSYVLLIREKRRRARFELEGQCYQCRVERRAHRTRAFSPNDCRGYQLCWRIDVSDCQG